MSDDSTAPKTGPQEGQERPDDTDAQEALAAAAAQEAGDDEDDSDDGLDDRTRQKVHKANREAQRLRERLKELEPAAKELQKLKDGQKTEAQRLTDQLAEREKELLLAQGRQRPPQRRRSGRPAGQVRPLHHGHGRGRGARPGQGPGEGTRPGQEGREAHPRSAPGRPRSERRRPDAFPRRPAAPNGAALIHASVSVVAPRLRRKEMSSRDYPCGYLRARGQFRQQTHPRSSGRARTRTTARIRSFRSRSPRRSSRNCRRSRRFFRWHARSRCRPAPSACRCSTFCRVAYFGAGRQWSEGDDGHRVAQREPGGRGTGRHRPDSRCLPRRRADPDLE